MRNKNLNILLYYQDEVQAFLDERNISVIGRNVPKPIFKFEEANLPGKKANWEVLILLNVTKLTCCGPIEVFLVAAIAPRLV